MTKYKINVLAGQCGYTSFDKEHVKVYDKISSGEYVDERVREIGLKAQLFFTKIFL